MPRTPRTKRQKTRVLPQRLAAKRKKPCLQPPADFNDVAVYFSKEEWGYLEAHQADLYREVMIENYLTVLSLGYQNKKPKLILRIEQGKHLYVATREKAKSDASRFKMDAPTLFTPDGLMVDGLHLTDDLENSPMTSDENGLLKHKYNFRKRVAREYSLFYDDDEVTLLKPPHKSLPIKLSLCEKDQPKRVRYTCSECGKSYSQKHSLANHQKLHIKPKPRKNLGIRSCRETGVRFTCSECGKSYSQKHSLANHQKLHTGVSVYMCTMCDKTFTQRSQLIRHSRSHTLQKPYICSYCGKGFTESSSMLKHQRIHTGVKPYECSECGKTFSISTYLIVHQRVHTGEKPYTCTDCGKCFAQSSTLVTHQRTHTGERPYACAYCRKSFTSRSHKITHERTHTGERPYQCEECGVAFNHSTHLVLHKRKHTGERPYQCPKCPRRFSQRPQLLRHQQKRHPL